MKGILAIGVTVALLTGCGAEQKSSETAQPQGSMKSAQAKAYPIDWCIVTGEKLGSMGDPVSKTYAGQQVKFCCKHCIEEFEQTPASYLARLGRHRTHTATRA